MSKSRDYKVETADGQSDGLQVLGIGEPWLIYLEGTISDQRTESQRSQPQGGCHNFISKRMGRVLKATEDLRILRATACTLCLSEAEFEARAEADGKDEHIVCGIVH